MRVSATLSTAQRRRSPGLRGGAAAKAEAKQAANKERVAWSRAEDAKIVECVQSFGLKWSRIAEQLPGRTVHAIRNRFHRLQTLQAEQAALAAASQSAAGAVR